MKPEATQAALIKAIVMNVFGNDARLSQWRGFERHIHEEDLAGRISDVIGGFVGEYGDVHGC